ncbi:MAG: FprA family A-type flavoprotein [Treponema sp.]
MKAQQLSSTVYCIHADIYDHYGRFEGMWKIPQGVSINSYIIKGEKTALIDIVRDWDGSLTSYTAQLETLGLSFEKIDYIILNHLEPDHSDLIEYVHECNPAAEIISTAKGIAMVEKFFKITGNTRAVKTGDTLDLGNGNILDFYETPNIHWPETMMTYHRSDNILFSCDAFGSYGCIGEDIFDDQRTAESLVCFEKETLRYYSNIVSSFSTFVLKGLQKLAGLDIRCIAPSHGLIWRSDVKRIIDLYARLAGYNTGGKCEQEICIIWGSMYGYTKRGLDAVIKGIESQGVPYTIHKIPDTDPSYVLSDAYKAAGLLLAMPTYEYKMFPPMAYILDLFERKHITGKTVLRIGNWGWVGGAKKEYEQKIANLKWNTIEQYEWQGKLCEEDSIALKQKGIVLAQMVKEATAAE